MGIYNFLLYIMTALIFLILILVTIIFRNYFLKRKTEKELKIKEEELNSLYAEIAISNEELSEKFIELVEKQEALKKSEERYRLVAESTMDIIWEGDLINKKRYFSDKLYDILGYKSSELEDLDDWFNIVHSDDVDMVKNGIKDQTDKKIDIESFEYRVKCKDGSYKWLLSNTKCEYDDLGIPIKVFGAFTDITELKNQQQKINNLAYFDSVTALPNRVMLREEVTNEIKKYNISNTNFALFFMDLDNFKFVNDSFGHIVGDKLLFEIGKRLSEMANENFMAFRLGGDEFIVLVKSIKNKEEVKNYAKTLLRSLTNPVYIDGNLFHMSASIGIVLYPDNGMDCDELLKNADTAMYNSKESGKSTYTFYHPLMGNIALEKINVQTALYSALKNNEFELYFQPIVDVKSYKIKGFEALIRWNHPKKGLLFPDKFISVAEENGIIIPIGKWVLVTACEYAKKLYDSGFNDFYMSVNISTLQLLQMDFLDFVLNTLENVKLPPELLLIEITESILIQSYDLVVEKLKKLKEYNVKIALDDFGSGYSSLTYLKMLPINTLKIDKTFISDIKSVDDEENITGTIILLAKQLKLNVIAEGVESKVQLEYLKKHDCHLFQGYLASKPVPKENLMNLLEVCY